MDTKYKSKICVTSLLLLNAILFSIPKLHSGTIPFSEVCINSDIIDDVKECRTLDQAAKFSQLIENIVQNTKSYCNPWALYNNLLGTLNGLQTNYDKLNQELALLSKETFLTEDQERLTSLQKDIANLQKNIANSEKRFREREERIKKCEEEIEKRTKELGSPPNLWEGIQNVFFSKFRLGNVAAVKLEKITLSTDDENIACHVYSPKSDAETVSYPCIVWLHGGSVGIKDNCRYSDPNQLDISFDDFMSSAYNFTPGLQPLARYLVQNGVAFATITIKGKNGKGNIRKQIKDQIEKIKELTYIDQNKMAFIGHSNGGHIMSQMIANEYTFLNDNFKLGIGLASSYINESWGMSLINELISFDSFNGFPFAHAAPDNVPATIDCANPIKTFQGEQAKYVYKYVNPFSITSGMNLEELRTIFEQLTIPVFLFVGLKDYNTAPTTQNGTVAWLLKKIGFTNWQIFAYPGAAHSPHRIQYIKTDDNIPDEQLKAFKDMLSDILSIGKGTPNEGTQSLKIFNQDAVVKQHSPELIFLRFENGEKKPIKFKDTDCGKDLLSE